MKPTVYEKSDLVKWYDYYDDQIVRDAGLGVVIDTRVYGDMDREALTQADKTEIKTIVRKELESELKSKLAKAVKEEVGKMLKDKATKEEIGEISKKIIKKLYKDLSFHHPYIIDRIKV